MDILYLVSAAYLVLGCVWARREMRSGVSVRRMERVNGKGGVL